MADSQPTDNTDNAVQDAPSARLSMVDSLPPRLADDTYVQFLARSLDEARADRTESFNCGIYQAAELAQARAQLSEVRAQLARRWTPQDVASYTAMVAAIVFFLGMFVVPAILQAVGA